eukprot:581677-Prorocentrum_minimum.AAC.1
MSASATSFGKSLRSSSRWPGVRPPGAPPGGFQLAGTALSTPCPLATESRERPVSGIPWRAYTVPSGREKRGYILMPDQSDTRSASIFSCRTNQTQEAR